MKKDTFLKTAYQNIPDTPWERLSDRTKIILEKQLPVFDSHCHVFDSDCIDPWYFLIRKAANAVLSNKTISEVLPKESQIIFNNYLISKPVDVLYTDLEDESLMSKTSSEEDWERIEQELIDLQMRVNEPSLLKSNSKAGQLSFSIGGIIDVLRILRKKQMARVLDLYINKYLIVNLNKFPIRDAAFFSNILMMDFRMGWRSARIKKSVSDQIREMKILAKSENVLPFLFVDPRREDEGEEHLFELFLSAFSKDSDSPPFFGIKVYPALGYAPSDWRLFPIWEICQAKNIPVLTHCGGNVISTYDETVIVFECSGDTEESCNRITVPGAKRKERASWLNDPIRWAPVLKRFPKLRLNFGHFGGTDEWLQQPIGSRANTIQSFMQNKDYPNVYADFSFNLVEDKAVDSFATQMLNDKTLQERSLFGTDFWVVLPGGNLNDGQRNLLRKIGDADLIKQIFSTNPKKWLGL